MNDNEITTIAEGCDPERCTDRVGGEHVSTCAIERIRRMDERTAEIIGRWALGDALYERVQGWKR